MLKKNMLIKVLFLLLTIQTLSFGASFLENQNEFQIKVDNRVLAKVNGKTITVVDVMKKMDIAFFRQFPEYSASPEVRLQFYQLNWRKVFRDLIDKELILADASIVKLPLSAADVRQEMEQLFGPAMIANLDKIDISFEDAKEIVEGDITIRRMLYLRVNSKALNNVTPQMVRTAYEKYSKENLREDKWVYYVITLRDKNATLAAEAANHIHHYLTEESISIDAIKDFTQEHKVLADTTSLTISEEFTQSAKDISENHKQGLLGLSSGKYSWPISQKSKDKSSVFRIFYLKNFQQGGAVPFSEVEETLKEALFEAAAAKEADQYVAQLEKQFTIELNPEIESLQPFSEN